PGAIAEGSVGAGTGASVGKLFGVARAMRGGVGTASARVDAATVGALVVVNAVGDVRDPDTGALIAGTRDAADGRRLVDTARARSRAASAPRRRCPACPPRATFRSASPPRLRIVTRQNARSRRRIVPAVRRQRILWSVESTIYARAGQAHLLPYRHSAEGRPSLPAMQ